MVFGGKPFGGAPFGANKIATTSTTPDPPTPTPLPTPPAVIGGASFVNGWPVRILNASARKTTTRKGTRSRSYRRQMRDSRRYTRASWECEAVILDADEAKCLEHVLNGEGHFFDFATGLDAQTGLGPLAGYRGIRLLPSTWGAFGRGALGIEASATGVVMRIDAQLEDEWTIVVRVWDSLRSAWVGHGIRSDGLGFTNGVESTSFGAAGSSVGLYFNVIDGVVEIVKDAATPVVIDDLAIMPFRACGSAMVGWTRPVSTASKMGPSPALRIRGDIFDGATASFLAVGRDVVVDVVGKPHRSQRFGWVNNARVVRFALDELQASYVKAEATANDVTPLPPTTPIAWIEAENADGFHNMTVPISGSLTGITIANLGSRVTTFQALGFPLLRRSTKSMTRLGGGQYFDLAALGDCFDEVGTPSQASPPFTYASIWSTIIASGTLREIMTSSTNIIRLRRSISSAVMSQTPSGNNTVGGVVANNFNMEIGHFAATGARHIFNATDNALAGDWSDAAGAPLHTFGGLYSSKQGLQGGAPAFMVFAGGVDVDALRTFLVARYGAGLSFPQ